MARYAFAVSIFATAEALFATEALAASNRKLTLLRVLRARPNIGTFLESRPEQLAVRTLLNLDANGDGHIDMTEVDKFGKTQGLDAATTRQEFSGLDSNGDGSLDAGELATALGSPGSEDASLNHVDTTDVRDGPVRLASPPPSMIQQKYVSNAGAEDAASSLAEQLTLQDTEFQAAAVLDMEASELHAELVASRSRTSEKAMKAAAQAANNVMSKFMTQLDRLEEASKQAELQAAVLRAKSKADLRQADGLMLAAKSVLSSEGR